MTFATGGTTQDVNIGGDIYRVHTFLADDDFTVIVPGNIEYLIVAGGGSGAHAYGTTFRPGGGGAGGLLTNIGSPAAIDAGVFPITIGVGGAAAGSGLVSGNNGANSTFLELTAVGGGAGSFGSNGVGGGCGGGAGTVSSSNGTGGAGTSGQGFAGGNSLGSSGASGGGGGTSVAGGNGTSSAHGSGGNGRSINITGTSIEYGGGGGGGGYLRTPGLGGLGGGGVGTFYASAAENISTSKGVNGLGGGGGGVNHSASINPGGTTGGDGIVIVRYLYQNDTLSAPDTVLGAPNVASTSISQVHPIGGVAITSGSPAIDTIPVTQVQILSADAITTSPLVPNAVVAPAPMPTEIRATLHDASGIPYADGTVVYVYNADGTFYEATTIGAITGYNIGVYPLLTNGQIATRFNEGDLQTKFFVVAPETDANGLVTNLLTAVQLIAGEG